MKKTGFFRILMLASILSVLLMGICCAAVTVDDVTSTVGPKVTLSAEVTGTEATSYQWYKCDDVQGTNPKIIEDATSASYTTDYLDAAGERYYKVVVNGTDSAVATVTATLPTQPVVFKFNNSADLNYWSVSGETFTVYKGVPCFSYVAAADGNTNFTASVMNDFYLQGYPYIVVSLATPEHTNNTLDIYLGSDRVPDEEKSYGFSAAFTGMRTNDDGNFNKVIVDVANRTYKAYSGNTVKNSGTASGDGFGGYEKWLGKLSAFRVDFSNQNAGKTAYAEYVGFFPTEEAALAYAGAMPSDDVAADVLDAIGTNLSMDYTTGITEASVKAYAEQLVKDLTKDAVQAAECDVDITVTDGKYTAAENYWEDGSYTFTVNVLAGEMPFKRSFVSDEFTMTVNGKDIGDVFVPDASISLGDSAKLTAVINNITATSYAWYKCNDAEGTGAVAISGANGATYETGAINAVGTYYYKLVVNGTQEYVCAVIVNYPTDPVIFKFNNDKDVTSNFVNVDGTPARSYTHPESNDGTIYMPIESFGSFYLQGYPYVVFSASYPEFTSNTIDLYFATDIYTPEELADSWGLSMSYTGIIPALNQGFAKTVLNVVDGTYKSYVDGVLKNGGTASYDGFLGENEKTTDKWAGKFTNLRIDISNGAANAGKTSYLEYIGFFPTEEAALAYAGAMPSDEDAKPLIDALEEAEADGKLALNFAEAENQEMAVASATALIEKLTKATIDELKTTYTTVEFKIANAKYERSSPYGRGVYTFDAQVLLGDVPFRRTLLSTSVEMELKQKPDPVIVEFNTADKVGSIGTLTTEGGKTFMRIQKEATDAGTHHEVNYTGFYSASGSKFNFTEYPYMKISYRRNVVEASNDALLVYAADNSPSFRIDIPCDTENPYWESLVVDMRKAGNSNSVAFYKGDAILPTSYGTLQYINSGRTWTEAANTSDGTPLEFRLSRYGYQARTHDYEYIAFFASEDEAKMYPERLPENAEYDVQTLTAKNTFDADKGVVTEAQAQESAEKYLRGFVFATNYHIDTEGAVFTAPTSKATGTYVFDVWFGDEKKDEYTVTVTMTMEQLPESRIIWLDSVSTLQTIGTSNAKLSVENGVTKMVVKNAENDDGFFLLPKFPGTMDRFPVVQLPYLKMRYKIWGINEDIYGNPVNPATVSPQIFLWMNDPSYSGLSSLAPYRGFAPYAGVNDGDEIELIIDTSYFKGNDYRSVDTVWVRNLTQNETEYRAMKFTSARFEDSGAANPNFVRTDKTTYTEIRLNLARTKNLDREAEVAYVGFFPTLDEAKNFDSEVETANRLEKAKQTLLALGTSGIEIPWGEVAKEKTSIPDSKATLKPDGTFDLTGVKTQSVLAANGLLKWMNGYIGAEGDITINDYTPATDEKGGSFNFDITLVSGYQTMKVEDVDVNFSKKPTDYIMWRLNDPELLKNVYVSCRDHKIEDNLLKMDHPNPIDGGNFSVAIDVSDYGTQPFELRQYSYILAKYKRMGDISPVKLDITLEGGNKVAIGNVGWGWYSDNWYYTLYDTTIRDVVTPWAFNYNIDTGKLESLTATPAYGNPTAISADGKVKSVVVDFGLRNFAKRAAEVEFIAFFPSMEDARNYVENIEAWDDIVSDTTVNLKNYTSDTVTYYDGNTQAVAEAKAKALITQKAAAEGATVTINTVSYTAPVQDTTDGVLTYTATVTKDNKTVYTTSEISMTIGKAANAEVIAYRFTNPEFVKTVGGAVVDKAYTSVKTENGILTFKTDATKPNVASCSAVVDGDFEGSYAVDYSSDYADEIVITMEDSNAVIRGVYFTYGNNYTDETPAALTAAVARFDKDHYFAINYAKTLANVKAHMYDSYAASVIADKNVWVAEYSYDNYVASTDKATGSVEATLTLGYGDEIASYYADVTFDITLAVDNTWIYATPKSEGHEFLGYDTITASKAFASVPKTLEFSIKVASDKLSGNMNILTNGSVVAQLTDGKVRVGGITSKNALTADTWTHVAVTSDGNMYINGALDNTGAAVSFETTSPVIGKSFTGHLMNVRFWSDVRTESEISANKTALSDMEGLLAEWKLTADSYKWLEYFDTSDNNNTATFKSTGWYKLEAGMQGDYSIIEFGDTQSYFAIEPRDYNRLPEMYKWIAQNKDKYNIGFVSLLGDATQNATEFEWDVIREAHRYLDGIVPYTIPLGNHDYPSPSSGVGAEIRDSSAFQKAFNYYEYVEAFGAENVGTFENAPDLTNMYYMATIGGVEYIFFSIEYGPRDSVLDWVGEILTKYPEKTAFISTHCYFSTDGTLTTSNSTTNPEFSDGNEGLAIYEKLVTKYPNIAFVTCGHSQGDDSKQHPHNRGDGYKDSPEGDDFGGDVIQILSDVSAYALNYPTNEVAFGADEGLIFFIMFEDGGKTAHTYVYSPLHDAFFRSVNEMTHTVKDIKAQPAINVVGTELREENGEIPEGMRYKMTLSKSYENFEDEIEILGYGMVLTPDDIVPENAELTENVFAGTEYEDYVMVEECSDRIYYEDDNRIDFTVVIHSIPDTEFAYSRSITARGYVDFTVNGGVAQRVYTTKSLSCSMNDLIGE